MTRVLKKYLKNLNNKSNRNHGNRTDGPRVFGMVRQNKSILEINKSSIAQNQEEKKNE